MLTDFGAAASLNADKFTHAAQGAVTSKNVKIAGGSLTAVQGQVTVTGGTLNADCSTGKPTTLYAISFATNGTSQLLLVTSATWPGVASPSAATINQILASVRPAGG